MKPTQTAAGQRLRAWLKKAKWTQRDLASHLGVAETAISMIALGHRTPTLRLAARLHAVTGIPMTAFVSTAPPPKPRTPLREAS